MRAALLCLVVVVGCKERNPHYCPDTDQNLCQPDAPQMLCEDVMDCSAEAPVCKKPEGVCVQCTSMEAAACSGATPVCNNATNSCTSCKEHTECASTSGVCMPDGSCAAANDVAYVAPGNSGDCSKLSPCGTLTAAVATPKPIIKLAAGVFMTDANTVALERAVTIIGENEKGSNVSEVRRNGSLLLVRNNADVKLYRLKLAAGSGGNVIDLQPNSGSPKLLLDRVTVGGTDAYGIFATGGTLTITRSTILQNLDGALNLSNTAFKITNNIIRTNGATDAPGAPLQIAGSTTADIFEFNTLGGNSAQSSVATAMYCTGPMTVRNNIIWDNIAGGTLKHVDGNCQYTNNIIGPLGQPPANNTMNMDVNPMFMSATDLHVLSGSPARNLASGGAPNMVDFDGEARPNPAGMPADLGADEIP